MVVLYAPRRTQHLAVLKQTTMPRPLPPEILDHIVDQLHNEPATLKTCCVVSKSWVPRARKHLFAHVEFHAQKSHTKLWKKTFPDPRNSLARHTRSLFICGIPVVTAADEGMGDWIHTFHNVVRLRLEHIGEGDHRTSLAPFYGLSPTVRSLTLTSTSLDIFDLICSFPLLEDLALMGLSPDIEADAWNTPSTSPKLTGVLSLKTIWGINSVTRRVVCPPERSALHQDLGMVCPRKR